MKRVAAQLSENGNYLSRKYKFMVRSSNPLISRALMRVGSVHAIATEPATSQSAFSHFLIRLETIMPR